jgi:hypothetical protein
MAVAMLATGASALAQAPAADAGAAKAHGAAKMATMSASGTVKSVAADSVVVTDKDGKDWTFAVDTATKVIAKGASHKSAEKAAEHEKLMITDMVKTGDKVSVKYHDMDGKMHAASVRVM